MKIKCKCGRELEIEWIDKSKQEESCCDMSLTGKEKKGMSSMAIKIEEFAKQESGE